MSKEIVNVLENVASYTRDADIPLNAVKGYLEECKGQPAEAIANGYPFMVYNPGRALWAAVAIGDKDLISEVGRMVEVLVTERSDLVLPSTLTMILQAAELSSHAAPPAGKGLLHLNKEQVTQAHELYERYILEPMKGWNEDQVNELATRMLKAVNDTRTQTYVADRLTNAVAMLGQITGKDMSNYQSLIQTQYAAHKGRYSSGLGYPFANHG